jgi:hypothetical protein
MLESEDSAMHACNSAAGATFDAVFTDTITTVERSRVQLQQQSNSNPRLCAA